MLPPANLWKAMTSPTLDRILRQPVNWSQGIWRSLPQRLNATAMLKSMDQTVAIFSRLGSVVPAPWQRWIGQRKPLRSWRRWGADRVWKGSIEKWEITRINGNMKGMGRIWNGSSFVRHWKRPATQISCVSRLALPGITLLWLLPKTHINKLRSHIEVAWCILPYTLAWSHFNSDDRVGLQVDGEPAQLAECCCKASREGHVWRKSVG